MRTRALGLVVLLVFATGGAADERRSGLAFMSPALRAMQEDETSNPGTLWVKDGEASWSAPAGDAKRSCASCHGEAATAMRGVSARYPAYDARLARPIDLAGRIESCRTRHQRAAPVAREDATLLALEAFVGAQSRGLSIAPPADKRLDPYRARGKATWQRRMGQLDLSCADCHDGNAGRKLAGSVIPEGHPTGYPIYRLEWQSLGSFERRVRGCMAGVRAQPFAEDAVEQVELELYLMQRAAGLAVETPAVRP